MVERIGVSLDKTLLARFDEHIQAKGYTNRSEAIRDLIRGLLIQEEWQEPRRTRNSSPVKPSRQPKTGLGPPRAALYRRRVSRSHFPKPGKAE